MQESELSLVLVGMMGCGKSVIGEHVSHHVGLPFYDSDSVIEDRVGVSIVDIFKFQGEDYFRSVERQVIGDILSGSRCVLSMGGGAFIQDDIRLLSRDSCVSYFLRVPEDVLWGRVKHTNKRPLVLDGDGELSFRELYAERLPFYELADNVIDCGAGSVVDVSLEIAELFLGR